MPYRFQWDTPFLISKYDHDTIYSAGNVMFKSTDEGLTWEVISGDLTRDLKDKQVITGTPWLPEYFGQEIYSTIHRLAESPVQEGVLWAGSDDGLIHLTRDGGDTWENVTIPNLPDYAHVRELEASPHDAATLYVAISRFNTADDYDRTCSRPTILANLADLSRDRSPRTRPPTPFAKTRFARACCTWAQKPGYSPHWMTATTGRSIGLNMPHVPVVAMTVKDTDLVVATNGRGFWILDDVTPLREHDAGLAGKPPTFTTSRTIPASATAGG